MKDTLPLRVLRNLTPSAKLRLRNIAALFASDLRTISSIYKTDKWGKHRYAQHYATHFAPYRRRKVVVLEIGIGGHDNPRAGANSLRTWRAFFPRGRIVGIDIYDKSFHDERRIRTLKGSQDDEMFLSSVIEEIGPPDIIIDDGSHLNSHVRASFECLFPRLKDGGIYAIEDLQTSYWSGFGGSPPGNSGDDTSMQLLKSLCDGLNYEEFEIENYTPTYTDRHIRSVHFYHNLAFVFKGLNEEGSSRRR
jgi:hypothetical protein